MKKWKKLTAFILALSFVLSMVPVSALAAETEALPSEVLDAAEAAPPAEDAADQPEEAAQEEVPSETSAQEETPVEVETPAQEESPVEEAEPEDSTQEAPVVTEAPVYPVQTAAETDGSSLETAVPLTLDESVDVVLADGESKWFSFTPEESGTYEFTSSGDEDTYCTLYDADQNQLDYDDDSGDNANFRLQYEMDAGQTYLIEARTFSRSAGSFTVCLSKYVIPTSGTCGDNLTWALEDGTLTISGTGAMDHFWSEDAPWFDSVSTISTVVMEDGVTSIGSYAFSRCTSLSSITIPDSVTSIGDGAFRNCTSLTSITIPDSVTSISYNTFENCTSLSSITIPDSVTSIGSYAFDGCTSLSSITIPDSVTSIGVDAFAGTPWLEAQGDFLVINHLLCDYRGEGGAVTIPDGVTSIGRSAFSGCASLTSITIPDSVTSIDYGAFRNCTSLTSITIPDSVTSIGSYAFYGCTSLTSITIPGSVTSIDYGAFRNCTSLTSITIPDSVTSIGDDAFSGCTSLSSITIPDSVTSIGVDAFAGTPWLEAQGDFLVINHLLCDYLGEGGAVTIPDGVTSIGSYAFSGCASLTSITIPDSVTSIGDGAFRNCTSLTGVAFLTGLVKIGDSAFNDCSSLATVVFPSTLKQIGKYAFFGTALERVAIPEGIQSIGAGAFYCNAIAGYTNTAAELYAKVYDITFESMGTGAVSVFDQGTWGDNLSWSLDSTGHLTIWGEGSMDGFWDYDQAWRNYESMVITVTVNSGVVSLGYAAFEYCRNLTSISLPDTLTKIEADVFGGCTSLTDITIPASVTDIGEGAFYGLDGLTIHGIPGTAAETYANENGIPFVALDEPEPVENPFTDVTESDYYFDSVLWASSNGITTGRTQSDGTVVFMPTGACLRCQAVTFLWRAAGEPEPETKENPFVDVNPNAYYYKAVLWAYENGITTGRNPGSSELRFGTNETCTRAQIVTFLWRAEGNPGHTISNPFSDVPDSGAFTDAILWAYENGITTGRNPGSGDLIFAPNEECTRAQIVTFLYRDKVG